MKVRHHIAISGIVSSAVYASSMSWPATLSSFIAGVLIDLDHVPDYWREYQFSLNLRKFFHSFAHLQYHRVTIFFHSWELIVIGAALAWLSGWNEWVVGVTIGAGQHLVCDQFGNRLGNYGYFFTYRLCKRFVVSNMFLRSKHSE